MPPTQNERPQDVSSPESEIFIYPHAPSPIDLTSISTTASEISNEAQAVQPSPFVYELVEIPREPTLKELVQRAAGQDDTSEVTKVKLQVIATDISLQYLSYHTPLLSELILDGSIVSSLRDLGCGLNCLKILRVNRCGLKHIDGTFGLESLEELYATKNNIKDISPCANLPRITVIDVRKNCIADIAALTFLSLCPSLEHIWLEENDDIVNYPKYRETVKGLIPSLKTLDGRPFLAERSFNTLNYQEEQDKSVKDVQQTHSPSPKKETSHVLPHLNVNPHQPSTSEGTYMVRFAPKVLSPRRQSSSNESPRDIQVNRVLPQINQARARARRSSASGSSSENSYSANN